MKLLACFYFGSLPTMKKEVINFESRSFSENHHHPHHHQVAEKKMFPWNDFNMSCFFHATFLLSIIFKYLIYVCVGLPHSCCWLPSSSYVYHPTVHLLASIQRYIVNLCIFVILFLTTPKIVRRKKAQKLKRFLTNSRWRTIWVWNVNEIEIGVN